MSDVEFDYIQPFDIELDGELITSESQLHESFCERLDTVQEALDLLHNDIVILTGVVRVMLGLIFLCACFVAVKMLFTFICDWLFGGI